MDILGPTLFSAIQSSGLWQALQSAPLTIFAPTEAAFAKVPPATLKSLLSDPKALANLLKYHIVQNKYTLDSLPSTIKTLNGQNISTTKDEKGFIRINQGTTVTDTTGKPFANSVIYSIDTVLTPPPPATRATAQTDVTVAKPMYNSNYNWLVWLFIIAAIIFFIMLWVSESRKY